MPFTPKDTRKKVNAVYKTLYIPQALADKVDKLAADNATSFNNVVVSMIEYCIAEQDGAAENKAH